MTLSMVSPALRHLRESKVLEALWMTPQVNMYVSVQLNPPADVVDGDVPQLLVHGGLALLAGVGADGGLRVLVGHVDFYLAAALKEEQG